MQLTFMCVFKYFNQRVTIIGEQTELSFKGVSKTKKKKTWRNRAFKIKFLLPFTGSRQVLGKMPENERCNSLRIPIHFFQWNWWELMRTFFWSNFENMDGTCEWLKGFMCTFGTKIHVFFKGRILCNDISCIAISMQCLPPHSDFETLFRAENWGKCYGTLTFDIIQSWLHKQNPWPTYTEPRAKTGRLGTQP